MPFFTTPGISGGYSGPNPFLDGLISAGAWQGPGSPLVIDYWLQSGPDPFDFSGIANGKGWSQAEAEAIAAATSAWAAVANIDLRAADSADSADIWYWLGTDIEVGALGWHEIPTTTAIEPLYGVFSYEGLGWDADGLHPGGYGYLTLVHEIGHGLGLAHPHDSGGDSAIFPGVTSDFDDFGDDGQNQGVYTVMSYNDGFPTRFPGHTADAETGFGYSMGPMALDIAAIQAIYGANTGHRAGSDQYVLPQANLAGIGWQSLWDTGGTDTITAEGASGAARIDLRGAPLSGPDAGGYVSSVAGVVGGFTIANGVLIENARGGNGDDVIVGNDIANTLWGGDGDDTLDGGHGNDELRGDAGNDILRGGFGVDNLFGGTGDDNINGAAFSDLVFGGA
ncbi:MAG: M10 family metallopeptidase C-terminal domain-containing protein, partial [Rhodobacteraceae bacterium]|nr:M10 family metallopeptidase C-terminal domain-containing protein [Paracoccaceae bacterium]